MHKDCDVLIVGDGLYAFISSLLLSDAGLKTLRVHKSECGLSENWPGLGLLWSTPNDPPTRALVAHGNELATYLINFISQSRDATIKFLSDRIKFTAEIAQQLRIGLKKHENDELTIAEKKFPRSLQKRPEHLLTWQESPAFLLPQNESQLRQQLLGTEQSHLRRRGSICFLEEQPDGIVVTQQDGSKIHSEMAVIGAGADSRFFMPRYKEVLVPAFDMLTATEWSLKPSVTLQEAFCFRAASGHFAGIVKPQRPDSPTDCNAYPTALGSFSGPRFALHQAGIGISSLQFPFNADKKNDRFNTILLPMIRDLLNALEAPNENLWPIDGTIQIREQRILSDCLPCDELPILGQWGTSGRVVGSTGWLGCGNSAACLAAKHTADLILRGRADGLHPLLSANRFLGV